VTSTERSGQVVDVAALRGFAVGVLSRCGVPEADAGVIADVLLDADLRGVSSHGLALLARNVQRVRRGKANPRASVRVVQDRGAALLLDGDAGLGPVVATHAMGRAIERAATFGLGAVGVRNANHFGAAGYYAALAAARGFIGLAASNGASIMAPPGGTSAVEGNNPIAVACPTGTEPPLIVDLALSVVSFNRLRQAARLGETLGPGWALDKHGEPTTDATAALEGLLLPIGGHKGFALALVIDALTGPLTGGLSPWDVLANDHHGMGFFFLAIEVGHFVPIAEFRSRMDALLQMVRAGDRRPGVDAIRTPGERSSASRRDRLARGIPIASLPWSDLQKLAAETDVELPAASGGTIA
jgi:LDH2 family malate/lactate/ureidoglycolate dehydrogenase